MIKKGQTVKILIGKDKTKTGKVLQVFTKLDKVLVDGINLKKTHLKGKTSGEKGSVVEVATPIHISNVVAVK